MKYEILLNPKSNKMFDVQEVNFPKQIQALHYALDCFDRNKYESVIVTCKGKIIMKFEVE